MKWNQQPEGKLIELAAQRSGLSVRQLAKAAGISDTRWRHIVNGEQPVKGADPIPVRGPARTLARMAIAVGITTAEMDEAGREDVSEEMRLSPTLPRPIDQPDAPGAGFYQRTLETGSWPRGVDPDDPTAIRVAIQVLTGQAEETETQYNALMNRWTHLADQITALDNRLIYLGEVPTDPTWVPSEGASSERPPNTTAGAEAGSNQNVVTFPTSTEDLDPNEFPADIHAAAARQGTVEPGDQGDAPGDDDQAP